MAKQRKRKTASKPNGPRNLKAGGFTNGLWRLDERDAARKKAAERNAHVAQPFRQIINTFSDPLGEQGPPMLIRTHFDPKPIPDRRFDWSATYDDYDADCDQDGFFSHDPVGYGRTEAEAVLDLITNSYRGVECSP